MKTASFWSARSKETGIRLCVDFVYMTLITYSWLYRWWMLLVCVCVCVCWGINSGPCPAIINSNILYFVSFPHCQPILFADCRRDREDKFKFYNSSSKVIRLCLECSVFCYCCFNHQKGWWFNRAISGHNTANVPILKVVSLAEMDTDLRIEMQVIQAKEYFYHSTKTF